MRCKLIESLLEKQGIRFAHRRIPRLPRSSDNSFSASYAQQRLWFLYQQDPLSTAYNISTAFRIKGSVHVGRLIQSLSIIVGRHETLRTSFCHLEGRLVQTITRNPGPLDVAVIPLQPCSELEAVNEIRRIALQESEHPFNLSQGPLIRFNLLKLNNDDHVLLFNVHHIVFDAMSVGVLTNELRVIYDALSISAPIPLQQPCLHYGDFAQWEQGQNSEENVRYWIEKLSGTLPAIKLPYDRSCPLVAWRQAGYVDIQLDDDVVAAVHAVSKSEGTTSFIVLLAAFHLWLAQYTDSNDILTGTTISGRTRSEVEEVIGAFENLLVIRTNVDQNQTFREYVGQVHNVVAEAYRHQAAPLDRIVRDLYPDRDIDRFPLAQVVFENRNINVHTLELKDIQIHQIRPGAQAAARFEMTVSVLNDGDHFDMLCVYDKDLFEDSTVRRLMNDFQTLLIDAVNRPVIEDDLLEFCGHLIPRGKVEGVIACHSDIESCVVVVHQGSEQTCLVAFVLLTEGSSITSSDLHVFAQRRLPTYMAPTNVEVLERWPLMPDGKIDRYALERRNIWSKEDNRLFSAPSTHTEQILLRIFSDALRMEHVGINDNFFEIGGDSLISIWIASKAREAGLSISPSHLFAHQTVRALAQIADLHDVPPSVNVSSFGRCPLLPIQSWTLERGTFDVGYWNMCYLFEMQQPLRFQLLIKAVDLLVEQHEALRIRFDPGYADLAPCIDQCSAESVVSYFSLDGMDADQVERAIVEAAKEIQSNLTLSHFPRLRLAVFDCGELRCMRLFIAFHHFVVDPTSVQILLDDLFATYRQLSTNSAIRRPPPATSLSNWTSKLLQYSNSEDGLQECNYWTGINWSEVRALPTDYNGHSTRRSRSSISGKLNPQLTDLLTRHLPKQGISIDELLLTSLALALEKWTGNPSHLIDVYTHGREGAFDDVNLTRTVGWLNVVFPTVLTVEKRGNRRGTLIGVKSSLRSIPNHGTTFGSLQYMSSNPDVIDRMRALPRPQIWYHNLGRMSRNKGYLLPTDFKLLNFTPESLRLTDDGNIKSNVLLDCNVGFAEDGAYIKLTFSRDVHSHQTIENLLQILLSEIEILIGELDITPNSV